MKKYKIITFILIIFLCAFIKLEAKAEGPFEEAEISAVFKENGLTNYEGSGNYKNVTIYYTIKSKIKALKAEIDNTQIDLSGGEKSGEYYIYTCEYTLVHPNSETYKKTLLNFTDINNNISTKQIYIYSISLGSDNDINIDQTGEKIWTKEASLMFLAPSGNILAEGVNKKNLISDGMNPFMTYVNESKDSAGTPVKLEYDNINWKGTFYIDKTEPVINYFRIDSEDISSSKEYTFTNDPVITFNAEDSLSGLSEKDGITLEINGKEYNNIKSGQKLSEIIGNKNFSKLYLITLTAKDKAGNKVSKKGKIKWYNAAPVITFDVSYNSKNNKNTLSESIYYSGNTTVKISIKDDDFSEMTKEQFTKYISSMRINNKNVKPEKYNWVYDSGSWTTECIAKKEGFYNYKISVIDPKDGYLSYKNREFVIDSTKPKITVKVNHENYNEKTLTDKKAWFNKNVVVEAKIDDNNLDNYSFDYTYTDSNGKIQKPKNGKQIKKNEDPVFGYTLKYVIKKSGSYDFIIKAFDKAGNYTEKHIVVGRNDSIINIGYSGKKQGIQKYIPYSCTKYTFECKDKQVIKLSKKGKLLTKKYGQAKITILYKNKVIDSFTIKVVPQKPKIKELTFKNKYARISWNNNNDADYYEVQISDNKSFDKIRKKMKTDNNKIKLRISDNKPYYVRVRAVKKENGQKYYGIWSDCKKIKK